MVLINTSFYEQMLDIFEEISFILDPYGEAYQLV